MGEIRVKRVYDPPSPEDGERILIDGIWPRGIGKAQLNGRWLRELAPSAELRRFFNHRPERFAAFRDRYRAELAQKEELLAELRALARKTNLTLLYAARDRQHNNAVVLAELLSEGG